MKKNIFLIFLLGVAVANCGKKGPLVLEPEFTPAAIENFQVRQIGTQIELSWKFPDRLAVKNEPFDLAQVTKVYLYHAILQSEENPPADIFFKNATLMAKLKAGEIKGLGQNSCQYRFALKSKDQQEKIHHFALLYFYGRKKSLPGPLQTLKTMITPQPIQDLKISRQGKIVILNWSKPVAWDREPAAMPINGYHVYRKISGVNGEPDFRLIGSEKVINEYYHDLDTGTDGEYEYQVSCRLEERIESSPSNLVKIMIQDTFAPDIPGNLVLFTAKNHVFLTWETVPDADLAFYRVYRKLSEREDFKLLADAVTDNFFRDKLVAKGKLYIYAISAVDKKGNESEPSRPVQQIFE